MGPGMGGVPMHGGPTPGAFGPVAGGMQYEFSSIENLTIERVGGRAKLCGVISLVAGAFGLVTTTVVLVLLTIVAIEVPASLPIPFILASTVLPVSLVNLVVGIFYVRAGSSLKEVATTQGSDVPHMMASLARFKRAFQLESIMAALALLGGIVMTIINGYEMLGVRWQKASSLVRS